MTQSERTPLRLDHPGILSAAAGLIAFVFAALVSPPPALVALFLSLPFFYYAGQSRWKDCVIWIIASVPFQFYFDIGGLSLNHTEMYLFLFAFAFLISRAAAEKSILLPSALLIPALYALTQLTPLLSGHIAEIKYAVRALVAVFFCPQPRSFPSPGPSFCASCAFSP
jgi:hypothetical protein